MLYNDVRETEIGIFENIGYGCEWELNVPNYANEFEIDKILDIKLMTTCLCQFDTELQEADLESMPDRQTELKGISLADTFKRSFRN